MFCNLITQQRDWQAAARIVDPNAVIGRRSFANGDIHRATEERHRATDTHFTVAMASAAHMTRQAEPLMLIGADEVHFKGNRDFRETGHSHCQCEWRGVSRDRLNAGKLARTADAGHLHSGWRPNIKDGIRGRRAADSGIEVRRDVACLATKGRDLIRLQH